MMRRAFLVLAAIACVRCVSTDADVVTKIGEHDADVLLQKGRTVSKGDRVAFFKEECAVRHTRYRHCWTYRQGGGVVQSTNEGIAKIALDPQSNVEPQSHAEFLESR